MTMAYCESRRSACLKRKVGAVIVNILDYENTTSQCGVVISSGHNDVPKGQKPCILKLGLERCGRDRYQEEIATSIKFCPKCGTEIILKTSCAHCSEPITLFTKACPKCGQDPEVSYVCSNKKCKAEIYKQFIPGASPDSGKLLGICRSLHAEENAIINLAKVTTAVTDKTVLYTTTFPCNLCANKIAEVGIKRVVYAEPYPMEDAKKTLEARDVDTNKFEGVKSSAFFRLYN